MNKKLFPGLVFTVGMMQSVVSMGILVGLSYFSESITPLVIYSIIQILSLAIAALKPLGKKHIRWITFACAISSGLGVLGYAWNLLSVVLVFLSVTSWSVEQLKAITFSEAKILSTDSVSVQKRFQSLSMLGFFSSVFLAPFISDLFGLLGVLLLVFLLAVLLLIGSGIVLGFDYEVIGKSESLMFEVQNLRDLSWVLRYSTLLWGTVGAFNVVEVPYLKNIYSFTPLEISFAILVTALCNILTIRFVPRKVFVRLHLVLTLSVVVALISCAVFVSSNSGWVAFSALFAMGVSNALFLTAGGMGVQDRGNSSSRQARHLLYRLSNQFSSVLGVSGFYLVSVLSSADIGDRFLIFTTFLLLLGLLLRLILAFVRRKFIAVASLLPLLILVPLIDGTKVFARSSQCQSLKVFSDPAVAIPYVKANDIELIVTDFNMGDMNGIGLAMEIQKAKPEIPIYLSTNEDIDSMQHDFSIFSSVVPKLARDAIKSIPIS